MAAPTPTSIINVNHSPPLGNDQFTYESNIPPIATTTFVNPITTGPKWLKKLAEKYNNIIISIFEFV